MSSVQAFFQRKGAPRKRISIKQKHEKPTLVTGGAGFIGSHICERLIAAGRSVYCLDNFSSGRLANVLPLSSHPGFKIINHDVVAPFPLELAGQIDEIYNLASPASPADYQADPVQTTRTNVLGAFHALDLAENRNAKIFQASTSEIYGDPQVHPQPEYYWGNVNPVGPRACYDEGKRCAESLFFDFARNRGTRIKVARIFNTYGPRMRPNDGRVVSNFIVQALHGDDITIYGDGRQTRSFCYVDDLVDGILRLMETGDDANGPVNLGNPQEFTVRDLAILVIDILGSSSKISYMPLPQDDPRQRRPDIGLAGRLLGWKPSVSLIQGLSKTIAYFEAELAAEPVHVTQEVA